MIISNILSNYNPHKKKELFKGTALSLGFHIGQECSLHTTAVHIKILVQMNEEEFRNGWMDGYTGGTATAHILGEQYMSDTACSICLERSKVRNCLCASLWKTTTIYDYPGTYTTIIVGVCFRRDGRYRLKCTLSWWRPAWLHLHNRTFRVEFAVHTEEGMYEPP